MAVVFGVDRWESDTVLRRTEELEVKGPARSDFEDFEATSSSRLSFELNLGAQEMRHQKNSIQCESFAKIIRINMQ